MRSIVRAELLRLVRRRTLVVAGLSSVAFSVVAALTVFSSAQASGVRSRRGGTTLASLVGDGGGTEAFSVGASFAGFFVMVVVIALFAGELANGTFRALLLREPRRVRLAVGKLTGILVVAAGVVAAVELATFVVSLVVAPTQDVAMSNWFTIDSLWAAVADYLTVFGGVVGWAVFGATLGVVLRSVPLALAVGIGWAGPFENIVVDSWSAGYRLFPGQVLGSLIQGGTSELALGRAVVTAAAYAAVAALVALALVARRDVTA